MSRSFRRRTVIRAVTTPSSLVNCLVAIQRSGAKFVRALFMVGDLADMLPSFLRPWRAAPWQEAMAGAAGVAEAQPTALRSMRGNTFRWRSVSRDEFCQRFFV